MSSHVTAAVLVIGDEILSGRTQDTNVNYVAKGLTELGIDLREVRVVSDVEAEIVAALDQLRSRYDLVFTTGGIGPTHDDITAAAVAKAFGVRLLRDPEAVRRLEAHYGDPALLNEARLKMAEVPETATLIDNPVSAAPGFSIGNVHVMAGVPKIMQAMFEGLKGRLPGGVPVTAATVATTLGEGTIAEGLGRIASRHPEVSIGSYPYFRLGASGVSIVVRGRDASLVGRVADELEALIRSLGGEPVRL